MADVAFLDWFGWWPVTVDAAASYRITRLLTRDRIAVLDRARDRFAVLGCSWCSGFWVALAVVYVHTMAAALGGNTAHLVFMLLMLPWAVAAVVGFASDREPS